MSRLRLRRLQSHPSPTSSQKFAARRGASRPSRGCRRPSRQGGECTGQYFGSIHSALARTRSDVHSSLSAAAFDLERARAAIPAARRGARLLTSACGAAQAREIEACSPWLLGLRHFPWLELMTGSMWLNCIYTRGAAAAAAAAEEPIEVGCESGRWCRRTARKCWWALAKAADRHHEVGSGQTRMAALVGKQQLCRRRTRRPAYRSASLEGEARAPGRCR